MTFWLHVAFMKSVDGHVLDIGEGLHAFFVAFEGMFVGKPGPVFGLNLGFGSVGDEQSWLMELRLALHLVWEIVVEINNYNN